MDIQQLISMLTDGLDPEQAKVVRSAIERDAVKAKAAGLREQKEFDAIEAQRQSLAAELEGTSAAPGTRAYAKWYSDNYSAIKAREDQIASFDQKYGTGAYQAMLSGQLPTQTTQTTQTQQTSGGLSAADVQREMDKRFQDQYAGNISGVVKNVAKVMQRHILAGRKTEVDMDAIESIMAKQGLPIEKAYEEWDRPEREKHEAKSREDEINRRVQEEIQKRGVADHWPAGADATPGALSAGRDSKTFDKHAMEQDLVQTFMRGTIEKPN